MKFDVIIGNPPYQGADGKSSIYPEFVNFSLDLSNIVCMITRDNWLTGMAFENMRNNMVGNGGVHHIYHYPIVGELFNHIGVAVAYFLWERDYKGQTSYSRIENSKNVSNRIVDINNIIVSETANSIVDKVKPVGDWADKYNSRSYPFMDQRKRFLLDDSLTKSDYYNVTVMVNKEVSVYVSLSNFQNENEVKRYKVLCGVNINEALYNSPGNVLTNIRAIAPMQVASETWSLIAIFDNETETINCKKYVMTKLFRFLANLTVNVRATVTRNAFKYIPIQDFTMSSDIDWSQSISDIDRQLYKKYNLTDEEIAYIDNTIKSMEDISSQPKVKLTNEDIKANYINNMINNQ